LTRSPVKDKQQTHFGDFGDAEDSPPTLFYFDERGWASDIVIEDVVMH